MQDPTLPQALHTINGETLNAKLMSDHGLIARLVADGQFERRGAGRALLVGAEPPADGPRTRRHHWPRLGDGPHRRCGRPRRALEDLAWAVLTSTEFLFTH